MLHNPEYRGPRPTADTPLQSRYAHKLTASDVEKLGQQAIDDFKAWLLQIPVVEYNTIGPVEMEER